MYPSIRITGRQLGCPKHVKINTFLLTLAPFSKNDQLCSFLGRSDAFGLVSNTQSHYLDHDARLMSHSTMTVLKCNSNLSKWVGAGNKCLFDKIFGSNLTHVFQFVFCQVPFWCSILNSFPSSPLLYSNHVSESTNTMTMMTFYIFVFWDWLGSSLMDYTV